MVWRDDQLVAFVLTVAPANQRHTFVIQAWTDGTVPKGLLDRVFERVKRWTELLGREKVRMETLRDPESWHRRWGFKQRSVIMELDVCDEEISDGQFEQDKTDDDAELPAETGQRGDEPAGADATGRTSDLPGADDGAAEPGPDEGRGPFGELSARRVRPSEPPGHRGGS